MNGYVIVPLMVPSSVRNKPFGSPSKLQFEIIFLENYSRLKPAERKAIDKAVKFLSVNPRPSPFALGEKRGKEDP